ncbi:hypothetical protein EVJ58_g8057 [Rhodofomes roseus]|uniref:Uncharacterized protein n=1 Tax=Rhodofomes roseus TaxID=34475 RepID=A0A4Y9Y116_9APHY|nr:hypothetical protein EVJ58_g8057 [Rhodofomes roseus]
MLEDDGEEVDFGPGDADWEMGARVREGSLEIHDEIMEVEFEPTQLGGGTKAFRPLFED